MTGEGQAERQPCSLGRKGEPVADAVVEVWRDTTCRFSAPLADLLAAWDDVSWRIARQRDNPACADSEHAAAGLPADPGMHVALTFDPADNVAAPFLNLSRPKVAILREQGVNSHVEMSYAMAEAGFEAFDVHMTDLQAGRAQNRFYTELENWLSSVTDVGSDMVQVSEPGATGVTGSAAAI